MTSLRPGSQVARGTSFSVAMCTYNGALHLREQLASLHHQKRLPDELIVCDDGSTDATVELILEFSGQAPFPVRLVQNQETLGSTRNFVQAITLCRGDLVALADQDDVWYPEKLEVLESLFASHPEVDGIFSDGDILDSQSQPTGRTLWQSFLFDRREQQRFVNGQAVEVLRRRNVVTGMAFAMRRKAFDTLPPIPAPWIHDNWVAMLLALRSRLYACPLRLVGYRVHDEQQFGTPPTAAAKIRSLMRGGLREYAQRSRALNLEEYLRTARQFSVLLAVLEHTGTKRRRRGASWRRNCSTRGAAHRHCSETDLLALLCSCRTCINTPVFLRMVCAARFAISWFESGKAGGRIRNYVSSSGWHRPAKFWSYRPATWAIP